MTKKIECPTCGVVRMEPRPIVRTTPWNDDCSCSDYSTCFYHRTRPYDDASCRPDDAVMEARAAKANEAALAAYEEQKAKFEEAARLKDQLAMAIQVSGELCEKCGWAMKFPGEKCRCELVAEVERLWRELDKATDAHIESQRNGAREAIARKAAEAEVERLTAERDEARAEVKRFVKAVHTRGCQQQSAYNATCVCGADVHQRDLRTLAFQRGVAAMREVAVLAIENALATGLFYHSGDEQAAIDAVRALPDPEDK